MGPEPGPARGLCGQPRLSFAGLRSRRESSAAHHPGQRPVLFFAHRAAAQSGAAAHHHAAHQFPSNSNALQLHAARRLSGGFRFDLNYAWSKTIDEMSNPTLNEFVNDDYMPYPLNYRNNRGPASFDLRHVFSADWSWQTRRFLGGWELHGVLQAQSGTAVQSHRRFRSHRPARQYGGRFGAAAGLLRSGRTGDPGGSGALV